MLGLGTGIAEGLLRDGRPVPAAELARVLPPAHGTPLASLAPDLALPEDPEGLTVEQAASLGGVQRALVRRGGEARPLPAAEAARRGDALARELLTRAARVLGRLGLDRAARLGRAGEGPLVLGQRGGPLLLDRELAPWFAEPLREELGRGGGPPRELHASTLRAAPCLGAVACELDRA